MEDLREDERDARGEARPELSVECEEKLEDEYVLCRKRGLDAAQRRIEFARRAAARAARRAWRESTTVQFASEAVGAVVGTAVAPRAARDGGDAP